MTNDGGLSTREVSLRMLECARQLVLLEIRGKVAKIIIEEANQRGEDYRPLLKILADFSNRNIPGSPGGTHDQQQ